MSTVAERRARHLAKRRDSILEAAAHVFAHKGFEKATTREIAQAAAVSEGTIYNYFSSKRELLVALSEMVQDHFAAVVPAPVRSGDDRTNITRAVEEVLEIIAEHAVVIRGLLTALWEDQAYDAQSFLIPGLSDLVLRVAAYLEGRMAAGTVRRCNVQVAARMVVGMIVYLAIPYVRGTEPVPSAAEQHDHAELLVSILIDGLRALGGRMLQRLRAIIRKEFIQTVRDRRTLAVVLLLPVVLLFLFGYAVEMQVRHIPTVVVDHSRDARSWDFLEALETSDFFEIRYYVQSEAEAMQAVDEGLAAVAVVIPVDFAAALERGGAQALVVIDGSDPMTMQSAYNAAVSIGQAYAVDVLTQKLERSGLQMRGSSLSALEVHTRVLYNPDMRSLVFMVPGMVGLILQQQTVQLTALAIVRERELGTIEQILVTPIRPWELMLGKMIPNVLIAFLNMGTVLALGVLWFGVPFHGSLGLFFAMALLFVFSSLGLGILVSILSTNQRQAQQLSALIMLPGMMLSGYIFPRSEMPVLVRWAGDLLPLTHFLQIARAIMTKGVGLFYFRQQVWILLLYCVVVFGLSSAAFKERLE